MGVVSAEPRIKAPGDRGRDNSGVGVVSGIWALISRGVDRGLIEAAAAVTPGDDPCAEGRREGIGVSVPGLRGAPRPVDSTGPIIPLPRPGRWR